ncbi:MAG TPA: mechanosensitive ion channel family protein [Candidatus Saccharimonadales bacterium]|nr:mechanosensitive ion channel family protein [Candidatus Saccharimonadales bacterium]
MDELISMLANDKGLSIVTTILTTAVLYLLGVLFMGSIVNRVVKARGRHWHKKDIEKRQNTLTGLFTTTWRIIVITGGTLALFTTIFPDVSLAPLFASAGIVGVALGFGAQSLVKDFLSGIFIISENQYRVGDVIEIEGFGGSVERVGARSTVIRDPDGNVHYFPNGMIQHVINKTMGYSMARFFIGIHPSSDLDDVIAIINKIGEDLSKEEKWKSKIIEAPAFVSVTEFTSTEVNLLVSGKTQPSDQWAVTSEMRRRIFLEFEKKKIQLSTAFPALATPKK